VTAVTIEEIDVDQLVQLLAQGARVVDVREPNEYVAGHVSGSVLVPLRTVPEHVDAFRGDGPAYVICRSGARSYKACEYLAQQGVSAVNVRGGTLAWMDADLPLVEGDQPT
jgi:rhodanese-related sulfurtransferase